jgi:hypothetical protein
MCLNIFNNQRTLVFGAITIFCETRGKLFVSINISFIYMERLFRGM